MSASKREKKILCVCGAGFATSTMIAEVLSDALSKRGITNVKIIKTRIDRIADIDISDIDLIVSGNPVPSSISRGVPVFRSISFFTGIGIEKDVEKIIEILGLHPKK